MAPAAHAHNFSRMALMEQAAPMRAPQRDTKDWIMHVAAHLGLTPSDLARRAGMSPSTLTRYLSDTSGTIGISQKSLDKIGDYARIRPHQFTTTPFGAFQEAEAQPYDHGTAEAGWLHDQVQLMCAAVQSRVPWTLRTDALNLAGYLKGDTLIVDLALPPRDGDIVCAQVYDWQRETADTIFRLYRKPWLMTHSSVIAPIKPLMVDDDVVAIRGVVEACLRPRAQH
jgi:AcrR family transcriptional regulator